MPYEYRDGYVYNTDTGKRKNKARMSKARAARYMRALYAAEGGYTEKADGMSDNQRRAMFAKLSGGQGKGQGYGGENKLFPKNPETGRREGGEGSEERALNKKAEDTRKAALRELDDLEKEARSAISTVLNMRLPQLTGSEKQVAWANKIRDEARSEVKSRLNNLIDHGLSTYRQRIKDESREDLLFDANKGINPIKDKLIGKAFREAIETHVSTFDETKASWWIDNRYNILIPKNNVDGWLLSIMAGQTIKKEHTEKANYSARAGQVIAGRLKRGADGKFASADGGEEPTAQERAGEIAARRLARQAARAAKPRRSSRAGRRAAAAKPAPKANPDRAAQQAARDEAKRMREVERINTQQRRASERRQAQERVQTERQERDTKRNEERMRRAIEQKKPAGGKGGGGGGRGGSKNPYAQKKPSVQKPALDPDTQRALDAFDRGEDISNQDLRRLARAGLVTMDRGGRIRRTKELAVYKGANGRPRWVAVTTTNFIDRDGEYISEQAIKADIERTYKEQCHGPLRFWHIGGPSGGLDIGDCDFRLWHGHSLIESGTFRKDEYAALVRDGDQVSPGFMHPPDEPGQDRTYWHIRMFERSITPRGRASNPHTLITTAKEYGMHIAPEKLAEFADRGGDPSLLEALIEQQETKEASVTATFKADEPETETEAEGGEIEAEEEPTPDESDQDEATEKAAMVGGDEDEEEEDEELYVGDMLPEELGVIIAEKMAPLMEAVGKAMAMSEKMAELKEMLGGYVAKKDDEAASIREQLASLSRRLKELEGDQPSSGFRASQAGVMPERLKEAPQPQAAPVLSFFDAITRGSQSAGLEE